MATNESLLTTVADLTAQVNELRNRQVRWIEAVVTAVDTVNKKIAIDVPDSEGGGELAGIDWPAPFLPEVGDTVRLIVAGAQPMHQANGLATDAITGRELAPGSVGSTNFEPLIVLGTTFIAGDPNAEHSRLDSMGLRAFVDDEGLPAEVGFFGQGLGVINPVTHQQVGGINDEGVVTGTDMDIQGDPTFGGILLSESLGDRAKGCVAWGRYPATGANSAVTNGELGFMELGFVAEAGRSYAIFVEGIQPVNTVTAGGWFLRMRVTTDGTAPTTASTLIRAFSTESDINNAWNPMYPYMAMYNGPAAGGSDITVRLLLSYAAGSSSAPSAGAGIFRGQNIYFWVMDMGRILPETGDDSSGGGTASGGTAPPAGGTTTKQNYTYETGPTWTRTWQQNNSTIVTDTEMHQGYGDSFNGNRRSSAGFPNVTTLLSGATISEVAFYMESYWWWNTSGGTLRLGYHGTLLEPGTFPGHNSITAHTYTARSQGKWIVRNDLAAGIQSGTVRGISIGGADNSATYYAKLRPENYGSGRPKMRIKYLK